MDVKTAVRAMLTHYYEGHHVVMSDPVIFVPAWFEGDVVTYNGVPYEVLKKEGGSINEATVTFDIREEPTNADHNISVRIRRSVDVPSVAVMKESMK